MFKKLIFLLVLGLPVFLQAQEIDLLILNQKYSEALTKIDSKLNRNPTAKLYFKKSMVHKQLLDYPAALVEISNALKMDSANISYLRGRADLYQSMGNTTKAASDFKLALSLRPDDLLLKYELGKIYLRMSDYSKSHQLFEEIQAVDSLNVMFNKYSALAAYKAKKMNRAVELYEKYIEQNPDDLSAYINIMHAYQTVKRKVDFFKIQAKAIHRFPNNPLLHLKVANNMFVDKSYEVAQNMYKEYMVKHDTLLPVYMNFGICLYHNKHTEHAIEVLEDCYQMAPNDPYINFYLGVGHKRLKNNQLAEKYLDFAIYISIPDFHPEMYHHLAQVYGRQRKFEKSIASYKKAYELDNRKTEVLFEIATTYEEFNFKSTEALAYYRSYVKEAGESGENIDYALDRIKLIKEELFMSEQ